MPEKRPTYWPEWMCLGVAPDTHIQESGLCYRHFLYSHSLVGGSCISRLLYDIVGRILLAILQQETVLNRGQCLIVSWLFLIGLKLTTFVELTTRGWGFLHYLRPHQFYSLVLFYAGCVFGCCAWLILAFMFIN